MRPRPRVRVGLGVGALLVALVVTSLVVGAGDDPDGQSATSLPSRPSTSTSTSTTSAPTTTSTVPPTTSTTAAPGRGGAWTVGPYQGLGAWVDVYDWSNALTKGRPSVHVADMDAMADAGIQTVFLQTSHRTLPDEVLEPDRLLPLIDRAHARGMAVVAWHLPTLEDVAADVRRFLAAAALPVDGLAVDIESVAVANAGERNRRLFELTAAVRRGLGTKTLGAITPSAVVLQVLNPTRWPGFPWQEIGAAYDVIVPMAYWNNRPPDLRGERYALENIDRIRAATGRPDVPMHLAGGVADGITLDEVAGMARAIESRGILGGSLYDWATSRPAQWEALRGLRVE